MSATTTLRRGFNDVLFGIHGLEEIGHAGKTSPEVMAPPTAPSVVVFPKEEPVVEMALFQLFDEVIYRLTDDLCLGV